MNGLNLFKGMINKSQYNKNMYQSLSFLTKSDYIIALYLHFDIRRKNGESGFDLITVTNSKAKT